MRRLAVLGLVASCGFRLEPATERDADVGSDVADAGDIDAAINPCEAPPTWADGRVPGSTLHVDAAATGTQDGSQANPFRTLGQAVGVATPGTRSEAGMILCRNIVVQNLSRISSTCLCGAIGCIVRMNPLC